MAHFTRWLMVGSVVASTFAGPAAEACWLTGCCGGGAPRTTFYAPVAAPCAPVMANPCAPVNPCATGACAPSLAAGPATFAQPTVALMPVTAYRPMFGGLFSGTQPVSTTLPYTAGYAPASPYTVGYAPVATPAWTTAPYTSYRPVASAQTRYAIPASYSAPVTVQYAPQPVAQAAYYAPTTTTMPATTTYMPTTTVTPAPVAAPAPGCNCHSSTVVPGPSSTTGQIWTPNSNGTVVSAAPITSGTVISSSTVTNGGTMMTSGSNTTFGTTNLGSQGVIQQVAPQPVPANPDNNVKPIDDPLLKKSSSSMPSDENDPRNKTALMPLMDNSQVAETKSNNAPIVRSLNELAPYNPVRMTSHVR